MDFTGILYKLLGIPLNFFARLFGNRVTESFWFKKIRKDFSSPSTTNSAEFSSVYTDALVEYSQDGHPEMLEIFRSDEFRVTTFERLQTGEIRDFENPSPTLVQKLRTIAVQSKEDPRGEILKFYSFLKKASERSRSPKEILENEAISALLRNVNHMNSRLEELKSSSDIGIVEATKTIERRLKEVKELREAGYATESVKCFSDLKAEYASIAEGNEISVKMKLEEAYQEIEHKKSAHNLQRILSQISSSLEPVDRRILEAEAHILLNPNKRDVYLEAVEIVQSTDSVEAANTILRCLLISEQYTSVLEKYSALPVSQKNKTTKAFFALAQIYMGELEQAKDVFNSDKIGENTNSTLIRTQALLNLYSIVNPVFFADYLDSGLRPVFANEQKDWVLMASEIDAAINLYELLLQRLGNSSDQGIRERRLGLQMELLACCLSKNLDTERSIRLVIELSNDYPDLVQPVLWALSFGIVFDASHLPKNSKGALIIEAEHQVRARNVPEAEKLFDELAHRIEEPWIHEHILVLKIRLHMMNNDFSQAMELLNGSKKSPKQDIEIQIRRWEAHRSGEYEGYANWLEEKHNDSQGRDKLLELSRLHAQLGNYEFVVNHGDEIRQNFPGPTATTLVADCAQMQRQWDYCLRILSEDIRYFPREQLSPRLQLIKALCKANLGDITAALNEATDAHQRNPNEETLNILFRIQIGHGDLAKAQITARSFSNYPNAKPQDLLHAAEVLAPENLELAQDIWRQAISNDIDQNELEKAFILSFRLGISEELTPLQNRLHNLASQAEGNFRIVNIDELPVLIEARQKSISEYLQYYFDGTLSIHMLANQLNTQLAELILLREGPGSPETGYETLPLFIQHGSRAINISPVDFDSLHMDVTSLLIAHELGLLETIIQEFSPIRVSPKLETSLINQKQRILEYQPDQYEAYETILSLIDKNHIHVINSADASEVVANSSNYSSYFTNTALANSCIGVVDGIESFRQSLTPEQKRSIVDILDIYSVLQAKGELKSSIKKAIKSLRPSWNPAERYTGEIQIRNGILCSESAIMQFVYSGAIVPIAKCFRVSVLPEFLESVRNTRTRITRNKAVAEKLNRLIDRVRRGLSENERAFKMVAVHEMESEAQIDWNTTTLIDLLSSLKEREVLYADDRSLSSYSGPIVSTFHIINTLAERGLISLQEQFEYLDDLRQKGYYFIPLSAKELSYRLSEALSGEGELIESNSLKLMCAYSAHAAMQLSRHRSEFMSTNTMNKNRNELLFHLSHMHESAMCIAEIWVDSDEHAAANIKATWIVKKLFIEPVTIRDFVELEGQEALLLHNPGYYWAQVVIATVTKLFGRPGTGTINRLEAFFSWISSITHSRRRAYEDYDCLFVQALVTTIKRVAPNAPLQALLRDQIFVYVEKPIQQEWLKVDSGLRDLTDAIDQIVIGGREIDYVEFIEAVSSYLKHGELKANPKIDTPEIKSIFAKDKDLVIEITTDEPLIVHGITWQIISEDPQLRSSTLEAVKESLHGQVPNIEQICRRILEEPSPGNRFQMLSELQEATLDYYYKDLEGELVRGRYARSSLVPNNFINYPSFLGFKTIEVESSFETLLESATQELIDSYGLPIAIERICNVPVRPTNLLISALDNLNEAQIDTVLDHSFLRMGSPIYRINLCILALKTCKNAEILETVTEILKDLASPSAAPQWELLHTLVELTEERTNSLFDDKMPLSIFFSSVWSHAGLIYAAFNRQRAEPLSLARVIRKDSSLNVTKSFFAYDVERFQDVLHHRHFRAQRFASCGVSKALYEYQDRPLGLELRSTLASFFSEVGGEFPVPNRTILQNCANLKNSTNSYLTGDIASLLHFMAGTAYTDIDAHDFSDLIDGILQQILSDTKDDSNNWNRLSEVTGPIPIGSVHRADTTKAFENLDLESMELHSAYASMAFFAIQDWHFLNANAEASFRELLESLSKKFHESNLVEDEVPYHGLIDIAFKISRYEISDEDKVVKFTDLLRTIIQQCPEVQPLAENLLETVIMSLPELESQILWPFLLGLRRTKTQGFT